MYVLQKILYDLFLHEFSFIREFSITLRLRTTEMTHVQLQRTYVDGFIRVRTSSLGEELT